MLIFLIVIFFGPAVFFLAVFPLPVAVAFSVVSALIVDRLLKGGHAMAGIGVVMWRFVSGRELDGHPRTNADWRRPAGDTQAVLKRGGRASWWAHQSLRFRAGVRLGVVGVIALFGWGMLHDPAATILVTQVIVGLALMAGLRAAVYYVAERPYHRRLRRLHRALAPQVGWPVAGRRPASWLTVPWDFHDNPDAQVRVRLPAGYVHTGKRAEDVEKTVAAVLGLPDPDFVDDQERRSPVLYVGRSAPPPLLLPFGEVTDLLGEATDGEPLLGMAARGDPVVVNLDSDSPHVAISAGTGAGKSVLLMGMAAQELRRGARLLILDIKRTSHLWAVGLPGVMYCRTPAEIHDALAALDAEIDRRYLLIEAAADLSGNVDPTIVGPRLLVLAEELNATMAALGSYWAQIRPSGSPAPPSPALLAWNKLLYMGRAGRMHVLGVAQRLSARAGGGGDARENFGTRCMARATEASWRMLAPEIKPAPPPSQIPGRLHVVAGGLARETQAVLWTPHEARDWASPGWESEPVAEPMAEPMADPWNMLREQRILEAAPTRLALPAASVLVTLREAAVGGVLPRAFNLAALRSRAARDPGFPPQRGKRLGQGGISHTYDLAELRSWAAAL